ncbi:MAG: hypothetical protein Q4A71_07115 [Actinomycetaceae bacterium]|nr:hypothetical protein [Actinomycetaceae bacterium]
MSCSKCAPTGGPKNSGSLKTKIAHRLLGGKTPFEDDAQVSPSAGGGIALGTPISFGRQPEHGQIDTF